MKKKIYILLGLLILLLPLKVSAVSSVKYNYKTITGETLVSSGFLQSFPTHTRVPNFYVSNNSYISNDGSFTFHEGIDGSNYYSGLSSNIGKTTGNNNHIMEKIDNLNTIKNNSGQYLSDEQRKLLEDLIINGYHYNTTNTKQINNISNSKSDTLNMIAMQILAWEVIEGGRTTFSKIQPDQLSGTALDNSYYTKLVYANGGGGNNSGTLYDYYKRIVASVASVTDPETSVAFNTEMYALGWDSNSNKYIATIPGLGKYTTCSSSDSKVTVSTNTSTQTAYVTSSGEVNSATITCRYMVGGGTNDNLYYYKFTNTSTCTTPGICTDIIYGSGKKEYSKSFNVTSKKVDIKIVNTNYDKNTINGGWFKFSHIKTTDYSENIKANDSEKKTLNKSGEYIVSQTATATGYETLSDFNLIIDISDNSIKDCTASGTDSSGNKTCLNGRITIKHENGTVVLYITSLEKNFKIVKMNENNDTLNGTTFEIKKSNNENVKFSLKKGLFVNDNNGSTDIKINDSGIYNISMLPAGEYSIIEKQAPTPYRLSSNVNERTTKIKIDNNSDLFIYDESQKKYVSAINSTIQIKNYRTIVKIGSTKNGSPLQGESYSLYASNKTTLIKSTMSQDGIYDYVENQSSEEGKTEYITNESGLIVVYDLPVGTYYFKHNVEGASFLELKIDVTKKGATLNGSRIINTISLSAVKNSFSFYKTDEEGNYLSGGKFKLQRYDKTKARYVDLKLVSVNNDGTYNDKSDIFREYDETRDKGDSKDYPRQFSLTNGIATFIEMKSASEYRIVETRPPKGYQLQTVSDTANVTIDDSGNAFGLLVLTNKRVAEQTGQAQAELIINIDTGQQRIRYAIIIGSIITILVVLFIVQRKKK